MTDEHKNNLESLVYEIVCSGLQKKPLRALYDYIDGNFEPKQQVKVEPVVKPEIADIQKITMWVDIIWNDIFDDDELPLTAKQMNIIGRYINDAKEKIRQQFSV